MFIILAIVTGFVWTLWLSEKDYKSFLHYVHMPIYLFICMLISFILFMLLCIYSFLFMYLFYLFMYFLFVSF